jgi:hypothetical protein
MKGGKVSNRIVINTSAANIDVDWIWGDNEEGDTNIDWGWGVE